MAASPPDIHFSESRDAMRRTRRLGNWVIVVLLVTFVAAVVVILGVLNPRDLFTRRMWPFYAGATFVLVLLVLYVLELVRDRSDNE